MLKSDKILILIVCRSRGGHSSFREKSQSLATFQSREPILAEGGLVRRPCGHSLSGLLALWLCIPDSHSPSLGHSLLFPPTLGSSLTPPLTLQDSSAPVTCLNLPSPSYSAGHLHKTCIGTRHLTAKNSRTHNSVELGITVCKGKQISGFRNGCNMIFNGSLTLTGLCWS